LITVRSDSPQQGAVRINGGDPYLREKAKMPRAVHGDEWTIQGFGGVNSRSREAFSLEEAPTFGRGSSLCFAVNSFSLLESTSFNLGLYDFS
jgi:hypothetical protein